MKKQKLTGLNLKKIMISKLQSKEIMGGGGGTRNTRCRSWVGNCGQAPSQRPTCQDQ